MKSILLIEDDLFIRDITSKQLTHHGFNVLSAKSAEEAQNILEHETVHLIILDLDLPGQHGTEFLSLIKNDQKLKNIPVIVFSNTDTPEAEQNCIQAGAEAFFVKINTDVDELHTKIIALTN